MREVVAPDGRRWRVARRWTRRRVRWRARRPKKPGDSPWWEFVDLPFALDEVPVALAVLGAVIALVLLGVLVTVFLIPLLLALVDALVIAVLIVGGALARVLLGRAWEVEATTEGPPVESRSWRVRRWGESGRAVEQVARRLQAGAADPGPDLAERSP